MIKPNYDLVTEILEEGASYQHLVHDKQELANLYRAAETYLIKTNMMSNKTSDEFEGLEFRLGCLKNQIVQDIIALFMSEMNR